MEKKGLLLVSTSYPLSADGSEAAGGFVAAVASRLSKHVPVRVVAPGLRECIEHADGVEIIRFATDGRALSLLSPHRPSDWPVVLRVLASMRRCVVHACGDGRVEHTIALWTLPSGWAARAAMRAHGVPYSVWALGSDIWSLGRLPIVRSLLSNVCRDAAFAWADGVALADDAARITRRSFEFLPTCRELNASSRDALRQAPPFRFLFLGRWHPNKGVDLLLHALNLLSEEDWRKVEDVHIAGGGPLEPLVKEGVAALQALGRPVRLSGYLDRGSAEQALGSADRLLLPSRIESIPVVFSDALQFGIPTIAMPVGDLPRLLASGAGWVAGAVEAAAFANAIRASTNGAPPSSQALANLAERFSIAAVTGTLLQSLLGKERL